MTAYCEVYFRKDAVFVSPMAKTAPFGFLSGYGQVLKLGRDEPQSAWGEAVLKALESFRVGVPMPESPRAASHQLLNFVGVKSWNTFMRGTLLLFVQYDGREIAIIPSTSNRGGFDHLPLAQAVKCQPEPQAVGEALLEALRFCS